MLCTSVSDQRRISVMIFPLSSIDCDADAYVTAAGNDDGLRVLGRDQNVAILTMARVQSA